jgi:ribokinase
MLQMEIPQSVNDAYAAEACAVGIPVFQDVGGADRDIPDEHLKRCTFVSPNLSELKRLTKMPANNEEEIIAAAKSLQVRGARNVLVTLGSEGSLLLTESGDIIREPSCPVDEVKLKLLYVTMIHSLSV